MEWVETTGKTIEEALDAALDELGVDEADAEYEVLEEPKVGLFGRVRGEARIRARVRPTRPRPKEDRRDRRRRSPKSGGSNGSTRAAAVASEDGDQDDDDAVPAEPAEVADAADAVTGDAPAPATARSGRGGRGRGRGRPAREEDDDNMTETGVDVPMEEQGAVAVAFLEGLMAEFGTEATVSTSILDDETFEVSIDGQDLGLFIGPKGVTMSALQDLTRTVVQRKTSARSGRLLLDVAGYRQRRKEALERFARSAADKVLATGSRVVLEPMNAADRKIIHDTVNDIDGVSTTSQGEDPRRRVVLMPESAS